MLANSNRPWVCSFLLTFFCLACSPEKSATVKVEPQNLSYWDSHLKSGDVIFRYGYGSVSEWINMRQTSNLNVSHVGIVVRINEKWIILHSISGMFDAQDGVQSSSLAQFLGEARPNSVFVLRPSVKKTDLALALNKALICWKNNVRFDHHFDSVDSTTMYCSEFVLFCYKHCGPAWSSSKPDFDFQTLTYAECGDLIGPNIPWKETHAQ
jgi:hypothetical protein